MPTNPITNTTSRTSERHVQFAKVIREAHVAGWAAVNRLYGEPHGACGYVRVAVSDGRSSFARWARAHEGWSGEGGRPGVAMLVSAGGYCITRNEAYARAYADVLQQHGIDAYSLSRLD